MVAPALADPQFVTLERADRESRIGVQASLQFYDDIDVIGLRTEVYGQIGRAAVSVEQLMPLIREAFAAAELPW